MKTKITSIFIVSLALSLFVSACGSAAAPAAPSAEAQSAAAAADAAQTVQPTKTPAPTEVPPPLPCTIAFDSDRDGNREIYSMAPDGSNLVNLTQNSVEDFLPAWSPDGSQIAYVSNRGDGTEGGQFIFVMNADGSGARQLTFNHWSNWPSWSPDGRQIAYSSDDDIFISNADGSGQPVNLTNSSEKDDQPAWSPDGRKIAWLSGEDRNTNIFVVNVDGSGTEQLTHNGQAFNITWTADGQIFSHWDHPDGLCSKCVMNSDGTNAMDAGGKGELQRFLPYWTLDGDRVECASIDLNGGDEEIYLIGEIYPDMFLNLTKNPGADRNPDWPANCGPAVTSIEEAEQSAQSEQPVQSEPIVALGNWVIGYKKPENPQRAADLLKACTELQIKCVEGENLSQLAEMEVDAIVYPSNNWDVMGAWPQINAVAQKGIPLFILDAETGEPGVYNLSNEYDSVKSGLEWMFKEMGGKGEFVYFNFNQNSFHQALIDQMLKENPDITATSLPADFQGESFSEESLAALLNSNQAPRAIWSDFRQADMFWMLKNLQIKDPPAILCEAQQDMLQYWRDYNEENPLFSCFSTINPGGTAYEGIYVAVLILNGEKIDPTALGGEAGNTFIYDYPKITNDNVKEWIGKLDTFRRDNDTLEIPPMTPAEIKEKWFME